MKKIVLTGSTGFVGANLARRLLSDGHELYCPVRKEHHPFRLREIKHSLNLSVVDLNHYEEVAAYIKKIKPDWILHLAVYGAYSFQNDWRQMVNTNILATLNLLHACIETGFEVFINTGSSSEYGYCDHAATERDRLQPNSYYSATKASATLFCSYLAAEHKLFIPTLRLYSVFGPWEDENRFIPTLIREGLKGRLPPLVSPDIARDFIFIEDVIEAYLRIASEPQKMSAPGNIYNICSGIQTTLREVVEMDREIFGIQETPSWGTMKNRRWDTSVWVGDNSQIISESGWKPRYTFKDGFLKTVEFQKRHPKNE